MYGIYIHVGHIWEMYIAYMEFKGEVRYNICLGLRIWEITRWYAD